MAEQAGYGVFWLGGSPRLPMLRPLLEASERLVIATGIVNVWAYEPATSLPSTRRSSRSSPAGC